MSLMSVYIHIPFCVRKCLYCDFLSFPLGGQKDPDSLCCSDKSRLCAESAYGGTIEDCSDSADKVVAAYIEALKSEIHERADSYDSRTIGSVFFGGGTPSVIDGEYIIEIVEELRKYWSLAEDAEVTLEVNPGTADDDKFRLWREAGVNRLSIGLQSVHDEELRMLGRIHTYDDFIKCYEGALQNGFGNINVDLMSGLPGQKVSDWTDTLQTVLDLDAPPKHISAYSLIIEEGTVFGYVYGEMAGDGSPDIAAAGKAKQAAYLREKYLKLRELDLPSEEDDRSMYHLTAELLGKKGYKRYEISNYALEGYECRHNLVYWNRGDYLGLGLGASSCMGNVRWKNIADLKRYISDVSHDKYEVEELSAGDRIFECIMLGFRLTKGIDLYAFKTEFGEDFEVLFNDRIRRFTKEGLLSVKDGHAALTERGLDVADYVILEFLR
ncbi:MAG: radical SAM family heme chaperone HemW [Lachnospiraceae bacterium]|nr:radical SAM family heme chaperone HemW [Lachnospiraceae bacterium]